jgi:hypothetical protein
MPLPFPPFIPSPVHNELWIDATWDGLDSSGTPRSLARTARFTQPWPTVGGFYDLSSSDPLPLFIAAVQPTPPGRPTLGWGFQGSGWTTFANANPTVPTSGNFDTGTLPALETWPASQAATFRLYTAYSPP